VQLLAGASERGLGRQATTVFLLCLAVALAFDIQQRVRRVDSPSAQSGLIANAGEEKGK